MAPAIAARASNEPDQRYQAWVLALGTREREPQSQPAPAGDHEPKHPAKKKHSDHCAPPAKREYCTEETTGAGTKQNQPGEPATGTSGHDAGAGTEPKNTAHGT
ncbi:MAG: hypothetical protein ACREB3_01670, partial [Burkholderiales bacterium]